MKKIFLLFCLICLIYGSSTAQEIFDYIKNNQVIKVKSELEQSGNANLKDNNGASLLMHACYYADIDMVKLLIRYKADWTRKGIIYLDSSSYFGSPLTIAAGLGKVEIVRYLIEVCRIPVDDKELDAETKTETGWTALHWAANEGRTAVCKYLLEKGADINAQYAADNGTPLLYAINNKKTETALLLINSGANVDLPMNNGINALHLCANSRQTKLIEALVKKSKNLDAFTNEGLTALMLATYRYHYSICAILTKNGSNPGLKNKQGYSAFDYAANSPLLKKILAGGDIPIIQLDASFLNDYIYLAVDFFFSEKYAETASLTEKLFPLLEKHYGSRDTSYYGIMLSYAGQSYSMINDFKNAEKYFNKTLELYQEVNPQSPMIDFIMEQIQILEQKSKTIENAEQALMMQCEWYLKYRGELSLSYYYSLKNLADFYEKNRNYSRCIEVNQQLLMITEKKSGKESLASLKQIIQIGELYERFGNFKQALNHFYNALIINEKEFSKLSAAYANNLRKIAELEFECGNYLKSEKEFKESIEIFNKLNQNSGTEYFSSLVGLAILYQSQSNFTKAEKLFTSVKAGMEILKDTLSADYAVVLNNLGELYRVTGEYLKSEELLLKAIGLLKELGLHYSDEIATAYNNLGLLYYNTGNLLKSESLFIECIRIRKSILGTLHPDYASSLNNLSLVYLGIGNFQKSIELQLESYQIREKAFGKLHPGIAVSFNNMGLIYMDHGELENAKHCFLQAIEIQRNFYKKLTPQLAIYIDNYAFVLMEEGKYYEALPYFEEVLDIRKKLLEPWHIHMSVSYDNLGLANLYLKHYDRATKYFINSVEVCKKVSGKFSGNYAYALLKLAMTYNEQKKYSLADSLFAQSSGILNLMVKKTEKSMGIDEKQQFLLNNYSPYTDIFYSYFYCRANSNPANARHFLETWLYEKGLQLNSSLALKNRIRQSRHPEVAKIYEQYLKTSQKLIRSFIEKDSVVNEKMIKEADDIEKKLINLIDSGNSEIEPAIDYDKIKNSLSNEEAIIELVNFKKFSLQSVDSTIYAAFVIRKSFDEPKLVYLFEEKQIQKLLDRDPKLDQKYAGKNPEFYYIRSLYQNNKNSVDKSDSICALAWKPYQFLLEGIRKVYLSSSGILTKLAFDALPYNDSLLISDVYDIEYLLNGSKAKNKPSLQSSSLKNAAIFGGIEYDMDTLAMKNSVIKLYNNQNAGIQVEKETILPNHFDTGPSRGVIWQNLSGTRLEALSIQELFLSRNLPVHFYEGTEASEEVFNSFSGSSPSLIHIATHGFYFPKENSGLNNPFISQNLRFTSSDNPMIRSGILLAGGNMVWEGKKIPAGIHDGVLTGFEVSYLDLSNTKLVVLSACQTGLGELFNKEGVIGLQRAFKLSGVDYMIVSLWQVPDQTTQELMKEFYTYWLQGFVVEKAFKMAQNALKKKYSAYGWAAFILLF